MRTSIGFCKLIDVLAPAASAMARKMLKALALLLAVGYCSLLVSQLTHPLKIVEIRPVPDRIVSNLLSNFTYKESPDETSIEDSVNKNITLEDIFISVKTSRHYQASRLPVILKTWFQLAKEQTWFFTDVDNPLHQNQTSGHMINTHCPSFHQPKHLCCKTSIEYDHFLDSGKKWFCHFDDDNYVNIPRLVSVLQRYDHRLDWYLGRQSVNRPVYVNYQKKKILYFRFGTGGAGYCISRSLALKMSPIASGGRFMSVCEGIRMPDDVAIGFVIEQLLKVNITEVPEFHSHLEQMKLLPLNKLRDQISFGFFWKKNYKDTVNAVNVPGFSARYDPTRFLSLHCFLFPYFQFCKLIRR